jgi:RimJ/RimL family protein N-acetyltransferase
MTQASAPVLTTARLVLRPLTEADWPAYDALYTCHPEMTRWELPRVRTTEARRAGFPMLVAINGAAASPHATVRERAVAYAALGVALREAPGDMIGYCGTWLKEPDSPDVNLGFTVAHPYWGRGCATEAARAVLDRAFASGKVAGARAGCYVGNAASRRVLAKLGMRPESVTLYGRFIEPMVAERHPFPDPRRVKLWHRVSADEWA